MSTATSSWPISMWGRCSKRKCSSAWRPTVSPRRSGSRISGSNCGTRGHVLRPDREKCEQRQAGGERQHGPGLGDGRDTGHKQERENQSDPETVQETQVPQRMEHEDDDEEKNEKDGETSVRGPEPREVYPGRAHGLAPTSGPAPRPLRPPGLSEPHQTPLLKSASPWRCNRWGSRPRQSSRPSSSRASTILPDAPCSLPGPSCAECQAPVYVPCLNRSSPLFSSSRVSASGRDPERIRTYP